ncbi:hypothetical protein JI59_08600 [Novosphingobium pentaromativorans US6-1]|nr:hypothetical protein JI59_08600 [Novosphingobium pentaromativorans US6-1]
MIRIVARPGEVRGALEDDYHHFRVAIRHENGVITGVESEALRVPYSLCPAAGNQMKALVGRPLSSDVTQLPQAINARMQCTHQFDLACFLVTAAARGDATRTYHAQIADQPEDAKRARLYRDGECILDWTVAGSTILSPPELADCNLGKGFTAWAASLQDPQTAEAALVLRRAVFLSAGRAMTEWIEQKIHASAAGGCWVQQPERNEAAVRQHGTTCDFSGRSVELTSDDESWLYEVPAHSAS